MFDYRSLKNAELSGKRVLLRAGFDVPLENGVVTDISRVEAMLPTMQYVLNGGAALIIMAHQDRPKGKAVPEFSQKPLVLVLEKLLGKPVRFAESCTGPVTKELVSSLKPGDVLFLENLRFDKREEENAQDFSQELASYADMYVNDAFTNSHRTHASMVGVAQLLPPYMGLQLEEEITNLSRVILDPKHPVTLIISGAKIETKLPVIENFRSTGDDILLGGAIANTFLAAAGVHVGSSLFEKEYFEKARSLVEGSGKNGSARIHVPIDAVVAPAPDGEARTVLMKELTEGNAIFDVGPATVDGYCTCIDASETIVWNGPLGMYEANSFGGASMRIAKALQEAAARGAVVVIGGGDTIDFHVRNGLSMDAYAFVSTGGGAMLEFVSGKSLPALEVLRARS